jgi:hypothetical protein
MIQTMNNLGKKIFGTQNDRELKTIYPIVQQINALEAKFKAMSNDELKAQTPTLKARLAKGETINQILPEAFATVREAAWRVIGQQTAAWSIQQPASTRDNGLLCRPEADMAMGSHRFAFATASRPVPHAIQVTA